MSSSCAENEIARLILDEPNVNIHAGDHYDTIAILLTLNKSGDRGTLEADQRYDSENEGRLADRNACPL